MEAEKKVIKSVRVLPSVFEKISDIAKESGRTIFADKNKNIDARLYENCNSRSKSISKYTTQSVLIQAAGTSSSPTALSYSSLYSDGNNGSNWVVYRLLRVFRWRPHQRMMRLTLLTMVVMY